MTDNLKNLFHFSKASQNLYEIEVNNPDVLRKENKSLRIARIEAIAAESVSSSMHPFAVLTDSVC
jgi:hypothetical protein